MKETVSSFLQTEVASADSPADYGHWCLRLPSMDVQGYGVAKTDDNTCADCPVPGQSLTLIKSRATGEPTLVCAVTRCSCPLGKPALGLECPRPWFPKCVACTDALRYELDPKLGKCIPKCTCPHGIPARGEEQCQTAGEKCVSCTDVTHSLIESVSGKPYNKCVNRKHLYECFYGKAKSWDGTLNTKSSTPRRVCVEASCFEGFHYNSTTLQCHLNICPCMKVVSGAMTHVVADDATGTDCLRHGKLQCKLCPNGQTISDAVRKASAAVKVRG